MATAVPATTNAYGTAGAAPATATGPATTTTYGTAPVGKRAVSPTHDVILYFVALFIPPLAVFFKRGLTADFWINILLWILGWIPGVLHAWWIISRSEGYM